MRLHDLRPRPGATHRVKRLGCGESSGHGKTSGKGHKGQKARSGGSIRLGFEGGQMPLYRRLPKRGFNNAEFKLKIAIVNLDELETLAETAGAATIDETMLRKRGLVRGKFDGLKVLGRGKLTRKITLEVDAISPGARTQIEAAGGSISLRDRPKKPTAAE